MARYSFQNQSIVAERELEVQEKKAFSPNHAHRNIAENRERKKILARRNAKAR
jgi:hypothetical protein